MKAEDWLARLDELLAQADGIAARPTQAVHVLRDVHGEVMDSFSDPAEVDGSAFAEWATSALYAIQQVLGSTGTHAQHFQQQLAEGRPFHERLVACRGVLLAARNDLAGGHLQSVRELASAPTDILGQLDELGGLVCRLPHEPTSMGYWSDGTNAVLRRALTSLKALVNHFDAGEITFGPQINILLEQMREGAAVSPASVEQLVYGVRDHYTLCTGSTQAHAKPSSRKVFIIHGHDEAAAERLRWFLGELGLEGIILKDVPASSLTVIEHLEATAGDCSFAIALFTPDDHVKVLQTGDEYDQMRPNVVFELGWFFGRRTRKDAAIMKRAGTEVPSDLKGIVCAEYADKIDEVFEQVRQRLEHEGLLASSARKEL